ncbi:MAG: MarR family winged helix-turn-helix transcriptional regulator, partial [Paracoccaceae bacterium]
LIEQSRLTKIIAQMDAKGWVTRRGDATDRRRVRVYLTPEGRALAERLVADARAHETRLMAGLAGRDGARIKAALRALIASLDPEESAG